MPTKLSDEELEALAGVTDYQFRLYVRGIRANMDYGTGWVGLKYSISLHGLATETYTAPKSGRVNAGSKSRFQVHRAIKALEDAGLLEVKSVVTKSKKQLILRCLLADISSAEKNKPATNPQHYPAIEVATEESCENAVNKGVSDDVRDESRNIGRSSKEAEPARSQISGITKLYSSGENENFENEIPDSSILKPYKELISKQGFGFGQILNKDTIAMISSWIHAFVTIEEAKIGIESSNAKFKTGRPHSPLYYFKPVLEVKESFKKAGNLAKETVNAKHQPTKPSQQRHKSTTQSFWDDTTAALERHYANHQPED